MNYWPTFSNWATAGIAAAIAIPSLLLLYFLKLRRREMEVSSTILWKKAVQDLQVNSPFQKLRRNLLLLLQMLILAALLLALSNPVTFYKPGATENTVILIDRSASMNAHDVNGYSRLEEAKKRASGLVDSMGRNARAMVIAFDDAAETIQPYTSDVPALKQAINSIQPTDRRSKLKLAYQLADAQMNVNPDEVKNAPSQRVFLYSDGRASDQLELSLRGDLRFEPIGDPKSKNVAIVAFSARRNYDRPTEVQIFARLANYGPDPVETDLQLGVSEFDLDNPASDSFQNRQAKTGLRLLPERWTDKQKEQAESEGKGAMSSVEFTLEMTSAGVIKLEQMNKEGDVLPQDDQAIVIVPPPKSLEAALVTDGNYFLEKNFSAQGLKKPLILTPPQWEQKRPDNLDVVIFDRYVPKYMPASGNYIWFGALPGNLVLKQSKDNQGRSLFVTDSEVLDWKRDHPMMRSLPDLRKLYVAESMQMDVPLADEVLLDGTAGPLIVLHREGRSTHLVCTFDSLQSNWPVNNRSWPLFMQNALRYMAMGSDLNVRESFHPGNTPKIPRTNLDRAGESLKQIKLINPDGGSKSIPIPQAGDFAVPALNAVGLYRFDPVVPQFERLAVNLLDDNESNIMPMEKSPGDIGVVVQSESGKSPLQLWWWIIACVGIPLLLIEWWVYTRRVHS